MVLLALGGGWDGVCYGYPTLGEDWGEAFVRLLFFYFAPFSACLAQVRR